MSEAKPGLVRIGVVALGYVLSGCSGAEVSAGSEGDAINLNRCYGADCGVHAQSLSGSGVEARPCGDVVGALEEPLVFEKATGWPVGLKISINSSSELSLVPPMSGG